MHADGMMYSVHVAEARFSRISAKRMHIMSKEKLLGWGTMALGVAFTSAGLFELSTGQFMPGGYRNDAAWLVSSRLLKFFREWGPYLSGGIWLMLAGVCFSTGSALLRDAGQLRRPHRRSL